MRLSMLVRMDEEKMLCLRDWAERRKEDGKFSLNAWTSDVIERAMHKEGIL